MDRKAAKKLYQASQAGVKIKLICRGICIIKPGIEGLSENIEVISIIDRFLEHSRIYVFSNDGNPKYFIGSADWMVRNFDHRFEVITPVYDKNIQEELMDIINIQLSDNVKARYINGEPNNVYRETDPESPVRSQFKIYDYLKEKYG